MDPAIIKLLEDDEDETMHSEADLDAFAAGLDRDIEMGPPSSKPLEPYSGMHTIRCSDSQRLHGIMHNPLNDVKNIPFAMLFPLIKPHLPKDKLMGVNALYMKLRKNAISPKAFLGQVKALVGVGMLQAATIEYQLLRNVSKASSATQGTESRPNSHGAQDGQMTSSVLHLSTNVSKASGQRSTIRMPPSSETQGIESRPSSNGDQVSQMASSALQLSTIVSEAPGQHSTIRMPPSSATQGNESRTNSHREQDSQMTSSALQLSTNLSKASGQESTIRMPPSSETQGIECQSNSHEEQVVQMASLALQVSANTSKASGQRSTITMPPNSATQGNESRPNLHGEQISQMASSPFTKTGREQLTTPVEGRLNKQQQQHIHFPQTSFPTHASSGGSVYPSMVSFKQQGHASQKRQDAVHQSMTPTKIGEPAQAMNISAKQNLVNGPTRVQGGSFSHSKNNPMPSSSVPNRLDANIPLGSPPSGKSPAGLNLKTPLPQKKPSTGQKKPISGQKRPIESLDSSKPSSKKQNVSVGILARSFEQINDVAAVSGVNLRVEEEQLFSWFKEDTRVSEVSRRLVREEEERLILQEAPLEKKLKEIMDKCGVKGLGKDVKRCLSLGVEERLRGLMSNLIRTSKQRVDVEKTRHQIFVTSDVRHQILIVKRKARQERERKQAEAEKPQKLSESDDITRTDGEKEKDGGRGKALTVNKEKDDMMRSTAANVAARAALGGDDMQSKWQLMAEQARQKREGTLNDSTPSSQPSKEIHKPSSGSASGGTRKLGRDPANILRAKVARKLTVKDVIAVLEREPRMSKSTLVYRLYGKTST